jgi:hypothetical protein
MIATEEEVISEKKVEPVKVEPVKVEPVKVEPVKVEEKPKEEEKVLINIDKDTTDGGIRINGKLYVGNVKVSPGQAEDLMRIQSEYFETKKKLNDTQVHVRMKSDEQKEVLFLADPKLYGMKATFTREYGLLPREEWDYLSPGAKKMFLEHRNQLFGY